MIFAVSLGISMILAFPITWIVLSNYIESDRRVLFGDKFEPNEDDNPLLLTIQAMENELAELNENNEHMERIQRLEKQIEEARKHAETLSKIAGEYGSTMEEVEEQMSKIEFSERVNGNLLIVEPERNKENSIVNEEAYPIIGGIGSRKTYRYYSDGSVAVTDKSNDVDTTEDNTEEETRASLLNKIDEAQSAEELLEIVDGEIARQKFVRLGICPNQGWDIDNRIRRLELLKEWREKQ